MSQPVPMFLSIVAAILLGLNGNREARTAAPCGCDEVAKWSFNSEHALAGWTVTGNVALETTKGREGKRACLKIGPGGKIFRKLRDADQSGKLEVWVYDNGAKPENVKAPRVGPRWGLVQSDGKVLAAGILYAGYLGGDEGYTATACDGKNWFDRLFWLGTRRAPAGWHQWTLDFDAEEGVKILHNGKDVNVALDKTGLKGFSAVAVWGDGSRSHGQTVWVADLSVTLGGPANLVPAAESDPYDLKAAQRPDPCRRHLYQRKRPRNA